MSLYFPFESQFNLIFGVHQVMPSIVLLVSKETNRVKALSFLTFIVDERVNR